MDRGALLAALAGAVVLGIAQGPPEVRIRSGPWYPPGLVISSDVSLVELLATVRDHQGHLVSGLKASDFEVLDENHPREITVFAEQHAQSAGGAPAPAAANVDGSQALPAAAAPQPRSIALFFDDAHASLMGLRKSAEAAGRLVNDGLQAGDRVAIFTASGTVDVDFTTDRVRIPPALARLRPHPPETVYMSDACPKLTAYQAYVIALHMDFMAKQVADAEAIACKCPDPTPECVRAARQYVQDLANTTWEFARTESLSWLEVLGIVIRHVAAAPEKRMLVLMSPGLLTGGMEERTSALVDVALRANITIAALNSEGLEAPMMGSGGHERWADRSIGQRGQVMGAFLAGAAASTGGQYIHNNNDLTGGLQTLTAIPEVSYLLGFSPPGRPDGKYHALKTRMRSGQGLKVESRGGYYSAGLTRETETAQQHIERIAASATAVGEFPATLRLEQNAGADGRPVLNAIVSVDASGLKFPAKEGRHVEELTFLTVLEDAQGNFLAGKQSVMDLALLPATLARYRKQGIQGATSFSPPPGAYRIREVVREASQDHVWASTATIEIR